MLGGGVARAALVVAVATAALARCSTAESAESAEHSHTSSTTSTPLPDVPKRSMCNQACQLVCEGGVAEPECPCMKECEGRSPIKFLPPPAAVSPSFARPQGDPHAVCSKDGKSALPTLLLLGVQKGGTTSLDMDLRTAFHSRLVRAVIPKARSNKEPDFWAKELHFFDHWDRFKLGAEFYGSYFPPCKDVRERGALPIDSTPNYFGSESWHGRQVYGSGTWRRAAAFYAAETDSPDAASNLTFVVILRDPAARYISAYNHLCLRLNFTARDCLSLLGNVKKHVVHRGCQFPGKADSVESCGNDMLRIGIYWVALMSWANEFPNTRLVVTTFNHYHRHPNSVLKVVGDAMGVVPTPLSHEHKSNTATSGHQAPSREVNSAVKLLNMYYEWHSKFFWRVLGGLVQNRPQRVAFVGTFGEF